MEHTLWAYGAVLAFLLIGCSEGNLAGNSAETGSPELAGILRLDDGTPAAMARVRILDTDFDAAQEASLDNVKEFLADSNGSFEVDSLPEGVFSLEAFHAETGKRLLSRNFEKTDSLVTMVLNDPGVARLGVSEAEQEGLEGVASILGSSYKQKIVVKDGFVVVDSLPAGSQDIVIRLMDEDDSLENVVRGLEIIPGDTVTYGAAPVKKDPVEEPVDTTEVEEPDTLVVEEPVPDTVELTHVSSLAHAVLKDTSYRPIEDFIMAIRVDSSVLDFDSVKAHLGEETGRFEAYRISKGGKVSTTLPISIARLDTVKGVADFWVRVDSLNASDSLSIVFNSEKPAIYAQDVFPSSANYSGVWHFDEGNGLAVDASENRTPVNGTPSKVSVVDGVIGEAYKFNGSASVTMENSAASALNLPGDTLGFQVWVKMDTLSNGTIFEKKNQYSLAYVSGKGFVFKALRDSAKVTYEYSYTTGTSGISAGTWKYLYFQKKGKNFVFYMDGELLSVKEVRAKSSVARSTKSDLVLGAGLRGTLDELVLSKSTRPEKWAAASYANQKPGSTWPF